MDDRIQVRAMEIIDDLEVTRRGPYSGGFGSVSFSGDMDIALALRTIVFPTGTRYDTMYSYKDATKRQEWVANLQTGAGIVADSNPDDEQQECQNKAAGLARAIDLAESAFVDKWCRALPLYQPLKWKLNGDPRIRNLNLLCVDSCLGWREKKMSEKLECVPKELCFYSNI